MRSVSSDPRRSKSSGRLDLLFAPLSLALAGALVLACDGREGGGGQSTDDDTPIDPSDGDDSTDSDASNTKDDTGHMETDTGPFDPTFTDTDGGTDSTNEPICDEVEVVLAQEPSNLMLVLDKSGSMVQNRWDHDNDPATATVTRWRSLYDVVDYITTEFNASINFGAQLFPSSAAQGTYDDKACLMSASPEVPIAAMNRESVLSGIPGRTSDAAVKGGTPATAGVMAAVEELKNFDSDKAARAIILVTDGAANCNNTLSACFVDPKSQECFEELFEIYDERLAQVVADAFNNESITTYVVGIDIQDTPPEDVKDGKPMANPHVELNKVAIAGGAPRDDANVKYYNASNELDLQSALQEIAGQVRTCIVDLTEPPNMPPDSNQVRFVKFEIDGEEVPKLPGAESCDGLDGWRWLEPDGPYEGVELCGSYCDKLKVVAKLDGDYLCPPPS